MLEGRAKFQDYLFPNIAAINSSFKRVKKKTPNYQVIIYSKKYFRPTFPHLSLKKLPLHVKFQFAQFSNIVNLSPSLISFILILYPQ